MKKLLVCIVIFNFLFILVHYSANGRSTHRQEGENEGNDDDTNVIELHVLSKRDIMKQEYPRIDGRTFRASEYPRVDGRTFRASEPLVPNRSLSANPQALFTFETVNTIYDPVVEESSDSDPVKTETDNDNAHNYERSAFESPHSSDKSPEITQTLQGNVNQSQVRFETTTQNIATTNWYQYTRPTFAMRQNYSRTSSSYPSYLENTGQVSSTVSPYQTGSLNTSGMQHISSERQYNGRMQLNNQYTYYHSNSGRQNMGAEVRGQYYGGEKYVDSNGHYIDAQGRHLDSSGHYYDISGRYQDARMTHTATYQTSGTENERFDRRQGGYYDNSGRYISSGRGGRYYSSTGTYTNSNARDRASVYSQQNATNIDDYGGTQFDGGGGQYMMPVDDYGGTQFHSGGNQYMSRYNPVVSQISSDSNCPVVNTRVTINGLTCQNAIQQLGNYVCYNYERVSTDCCERCLQIKQPDQVGCEYGDRSSQCRDIEPFNCYNERNRQICCERCNQFKQLLANTKSPGCEYGDQTPRCQDIVNRTYLCYLPENQRICCSTCSRLARQNEPDCQWGNQNPEFCDPFDSNRHLRLNCYIQAVREVCCSTCKSLGNRIPETITGCEYGDSPTLFSSGPTIYDCGEYIRQYGLENCNDPEISSKCCYTCYRYQRARG